MLFSKWDASFFTRVQLLIHIILLSDRENDLEVKHCKVTLRKIGQRHTQLSVKMEPPVQLWSEKGLSTVFTSTHSNHVWKIVRKAVASSFSAAKIRYLLKINKKELYIPQLLAVQRVVKRCSGMCCSHYMITKEQSCTSPRAFWSLQKAFTKLINAV